MDHRIADNARAIRAVIAMSAAVALGFLILSIERGNTDDRESTVRSLNGMLWGISELNFESQRFINALDNQALGRGSLEETAIRFEVLWSRHDVVAVRKFAKDTGFHELMDGFEAYLHRYEPVIYGDTAPSAEVLAQMADELSTLTITARHLWSNSFGTQNPASRVLARVELQRSNKYAVAVAATLVTMLLIYVIAEVYFASLGQKREKKLRLAAAQANDAKSRFLANVSHEVRTPLNGILGMASELAETAVNADQRHCIDVIIESGAVLLSTINDVLDISRIESGNLEVESAPFELREVVAGACALYQARAREKGLMLDFRVQENLPLWILGDGLRLRQVLNNLIANAVKFTDQGGVSVRVRPEPGGARLSISVKDTGPGIDREAQQRIFEPFIQADAGVTRIHGGTGLGLAISRQLCVAMGGGLDVISRPGFGATFIVSLPLAKAEKVAARQPVGPVAAPVSLAGKRVLIVDDNATNRLVLDRFLKGSKARLDFAASGEEALELATADIFDVILMDVQMPRMDGMAATEAIRSIEAQEHRPRSLIIAVTANVMTHQVEEYLLSGADEVLPKPVSKGALMTMLGARLAQRAA